MPLDEEIKGIGDVTSGIGKGITGSSKKLSEKIRDNDDMNKSGIHKILKKCKRQVLSRNVWYKETNSKND